MVYTLKVRRDTDEAGPGQYVATVREFPELKGFGYTGTEAKAAVMKLAISKANKVAAEEPRTGSERSFAARERGRNAAGNLEKVNPNPLKPSIEPPAPVRSGDISESNWRGGGWTRGGVAPRR